MGGIIIYQRQVTKCIENEKCNILLGRQWITCIELVVEISQLGGIHVTGGKLVRHKAGCNTLSTF